MSTLTKAADCESFFKASLLSYYQAALSESSACSSDDYILQLACTRCAADY